MEDRIIRYVVVSNVVFEPYLSDELRKVFSKHRMQCEITYIGLEELFNTSPLILKGADVVIICVNFQVMFPNWLNDIEGDRYIADELQTCLYERCKKIYLYVKEITFAAVIWLGFEECNCFYYRVVGTVLVQKGFINLMNNLLCQMIVQQDVFIDLKLIISRVGSLNAYNMKGMWRWHAPYSRIMIQELSREIHKQHLIQFGITPKCIIVDCDNVLWGGIISEDGIEKIQLGGIAGNAYQEFQRNLLFLYQHGVILAICSKNNEADVKKVFNEHTGMILREQHIACFRINWKDKVDNIIQISEELNIDLGSMVFVDDSEIEIHSVENALPNLKTILFNKYTISEQLTCFNLKNEVDLQNVRYRNQIYKTNHYREELRNKVSHQEFQNALDIRIKIHETVPIELKRISELSQRTNKFTNGIRYTHETLREKLYHEGYNLFTVTLSDKFSEFGIVGAIGFYDDVLDLFLVSCRAFGWGVEDEMVEFIKKYSLNNYRFQDTGKNQEVSCFLAKTISE